MQYFFKDHNNNMIFRKTNSADIPGQAQNHKKVILK